MENANQIAMIAMYLLVGLTSGGLASLEARQRQAKEEAERIMREEMVSRRIAEQKDAFIRIASHDLKNPLLGIYGSARVLEKILEPGGVIEDDAYDLLTRISKNALLMQHIIEDFLDFHALEDGEITITRKPADLNTIAQNAVDHNVDYAAQKGSKILTDLTDSPPLVEADEKRIEQVVLNLLSNAIKFSPKGAKVVVRTRQKEAAVVLEIQDNGPGLTEEDKENLFKKYARLSNKPTGGEKSSGLGLSICKQLVDLHGGDIGAENNSDGGATFWIELSATETHEERS